MIPHLRTELIIEMLSHLKIRFNNLFHFHCRFTKNEELLEEFAVRTSKQNVPSPRVQTQYCFPAAAAKSVRAKMIVSRSVTFLVFHF